MARGYGQFCGVARALEIVGERWGLLVVRDLLVGPRRFSELRRGLPKIPTNVLSTRLRELEAAGVVRRRLLARPETGFEYELTEYGHDLEEAVMAFGRWGARSLAEPGQDEIVTADSLVMALRSTFRPQAARGFRGSFELRMGDVVVHARIDRERLDVAAGGLAGAELARETGPILPAFMAGGADPPAATNGGDVRLTGDARLLDRFVELFQIGSAPTRPGAATIG